MVLIKPTIEINFSLHTQTLLNMMYYILLLLIILNMGCQK